MTQESVGVAPDVEELLATAPSGETPDLSGAYPRLSEEQIRILSGYGSRRPTSRSELLITEGRPDEASIVALADPCTGWLAGTSRSTPAPPCAPARTRPWPPGVTPIGNRGGRPRCRRRLSRVCSRQATFAADRSSGVTSAVGEGAMAVRLVHEHLAQVG